MKFFFIFVFFIFIQEIHQFTDSNKITDLTDICKNALTINYFLPYGMGYVDSMVLGLNEVKKNCTIVFHTDSIISDGNETKIFQIVVLEALKDSRQQNITKNIQILDENDNPFNGSINLSATYVAIFPDLKISLLMDGSSYPLKITATSSRKANGITCQENEIQCRILNYSLCINHELLCDGNFNCGSGVFFDEAVSLCLPELRKEHVWFIITCALILVFFIAVLARCVHKLIPKIPKTFSNERRERPVAEAQLIYRQIRLTQPRNPRVIVNYHRADLNPMHSTESKGSSTRSEYLEEEISGHLYSAGKLYKANQKVVHKRKERLTTNSPVNLRAREDQYVREKFGREIWFLSDGQRHRLKRESGWYSN